MTHGASGRRFDGERPSRRLRELAALAAIAFGAIVLIASSSLRLETAPVQEVRDGQPVPVRVVANGAS